MSDDIKTWIVERFKENTDLKEDEIGEKENYFEKGWLDSFKFISFITNIEEKFDIRFSNDEFQDRSFSMIEGIVEIIQRKTNEK